MKIVAGLLLLIASALAYPVAESDVKNSDVPLVITDYSSVAKAEAPHAAAHGEPGHVHDSEESSSSESAETENTKDDIKQEKSAEISEEGVMQDGIPSATLNAKEEKKEVKEKAEESPKPQEASPTTKAAIEIKSKELKKDGAPKSENKEEEKKEATPALKSLPVGEHAKVAEKPAKSEGFVTPSVVPSGKFAEPTAEKKSEEQAPTEVEKPLALPALKKDLPAEPTKADEVIPSEQKVEASPVAEEVLPKLKSTENLEVKPELPKTEKIAEQKEVVPEKREESAEKLEDNKVEQVKEVKKEVEEIKQEKIDEIKPINVPKSKSASISETKPEENKKEEEIPEVKPEAFVPVVKPLSDSEEIKVEKKSLPVTSQGVTPLSESKPAEQKEDKITEKQKDAETPKQEEKPKEEEKPKLEEAKATAKSIEESKPEEKKSEEVTTEKLPVTSASSS